MATFAPGVRHVDVVNGPIKGSIGVHVAASLLGGLPDRYGL